MDTNGQPRPDRQGGTTSPPDNHEVTGRCEHVSRVIARVSDKWTLLVVRSLAKHPLRFNALQREMGKVSQKMLAATLRALEENGFVTRTVTPTMPPQVEYALTQLGHDFVQPVHAFAGWVVENTGRIDAAREAYARRSA